MKRATAIVAGCVAYAAGAATATAQDKSIPVRNAVTLARTGETFYSLNGLHALSNGNILVNDGRRRLMFLFDSTFAKYTIVFDSTMGAANYYGPRVAPLFAYLGDSSLTVDYDANALLLVEPSGKIARAMAPPSAADLPVMNIIAGVGFDPRGRLIYRGTVPRAPNAPGLALPPDSLPLVRADFQTRRVDTLALVKNRTPGGIAQTTDAQGRVNLTLTVNVLPTSDQWAVMSDGTVAIVRGHDYHIDFIHLDGSKSSTGKLPFDWRRLTDADKERITDSARAASATPPPPPLAAPGAGARGGDGRGGGGGGDVAAARGGGGGGRGGGDGRGGDAPPIGRLETVYPPASQLPDYVPPINNNAVRGDRDGNLWILPATSLLATGGSLVYDVVNRNGELFERVRVPAGRSIVGFGPGGVLILQDGIPSTGFHLERARVERK